MALTRKAPKQDIRNLTIATVTTTETGAVPPASKKPIETLTLYNPSADLRLILISILPLVVILGIASYMDSVHPWVIPFAMWLLKIGG